MSLRVLQLPITKFFVTTVKRENVLERFVPVLFEISVFSCLKAEIMVHWTKRLVWHPVISAAVLVFFMNKPRDFFPSGCFLNHISLTGFWMTAK